MTVINPISGNNPARPVDEYENEQVKGLALCAQGNLDDYLARVGKLRQREADYRASLPTSAENCISGAVKLLHPGAEEYPEGFEEALYLSFALAPMVRWMRTDDPGIERDAVCFVAGLVQRNLERTAEKLNRISDILCNPGRIECEARAEKLRRFSAQATQQGQEDRV